MTAGGRRKPPRATVASLSALGAAPLAELLLAASRGDTGLKRVRRPRLRLAPAHRTLP